MGRRAVAGRDIAAGGGLSTRRLRRYEVRVVEGDARSSYDHRAAARCCRTTSGADVPSNYGTTGFQPSGVSFPTEGCWEVTGHVGDTTLTFVTFCIMLGP